MKSFLLNLQNRDRKIRKNQVNFGRIVLGQSP